jgi:uncharacterized protein YndB with AHSA1/START domain
MAHAVSITVQASPAIVWQLLTDVESWPRWTPSMLSVSRLDRGEFRLGSRAAIKQPGMPIAVWAVSELEPGRSFAWTSKSVGVTTVGGHVVEPAGDGARLTLTVRQTGPFAGAIGLLFGRRIRRWIGLEAEGFRRAAEQP